ncbi:hypothetical protein AOLI_G00293960 [Acnodon oligacanthus]
MVGIEVGTEPDMCWDVLERKTASHRAKPKLGCIIMFLPAERWSKKLAAQLQPEGQQNERRTVLTWVCMWNTDQREHSGPANAPTPHAPHRGSASSSL